MRASHLWTTACSGNGLTKFLINMLSTSYLKARLYPLGNNDLTAHTTPAARVLAGTTTFRTSRTSTSPSGCVAEAEVQARLRNVNHPKAQASTKLWKLAAA